MIAPRVALFTGGSTIGLDCIETLASAGFPTLVVTPPMGRRERIRRLVRRDPPAIERLARSAGMAVAHHGGGRDCEPALRAFRPDFICIAIFPRLVPERLTALAPALNIHPSLLPRHRGPLPLFWTYHAGDAQAGLTVHHATARFDAGQIIAQEQITLPRGYPVERLANDLAKRSGALLLRAIDAVRTGAAGVTQDEGAATMAPIIDRTSPHVRFDAWDVEQVWHFLAGLASQYREPLADSDGRAVAYRGISSFARDRAKAPGLVERDGKGWVLHCIGGTIRLTA